jgi:hypothetical protein
VTLPKREETKARRIEVKSDGDVPKTIEARTEGSKLLQPKVSWYLKTLTGRRQIFASRPFSFRFAED